MQVLGIPYRHGRTLMNLCEEGGERKGEWWWPCNSDHHHSPLPGSLAVGVADWLAVPAEPSEAVPGHLMIMLVGVGRRGRGAEPGDLSGALEPCACVACSPSACVGLASGGLGYPVHGEARWPARFWLCVDASGCGSGCAQSVMRNEPERQRLAVLVVSVGLVC